MTTNTSPAEPVLLRAGELSKQYVVPRGEPVHALEPMSFDIRDGEFIALVGPSGCGKSTLLNMIGGLVDRTSGELTIRGEEIRAPRREIGMMFQAPVLFPWRTILSNVLLPVDVRRANRSEHRARAEALLDLVGLSDFGSSYPSQLSGGMQQRASLARLLVQNPDVMLLDEPFGALDEFTREDMNLMLLDIWSSMSKTAILVTHNIPEAVFLADRVFVMSPRPGRLVDVIDVD
ncbi:MAG: ABC transporter ATP-binding protein, partial [Ilumatobacteraceae bacterium]